ncbi:hypothetical protein ACVWZV_002205 [Bradyrhizobium sp. GM5.1]
MAYKRKTLFARVSNSSGTFLSNWYNIDFRGFSKTLNAGPGECVIRYAVPFHYDGADLQSGNDVELVICDNDTLDDNTEPSMGNSKIIYKGYLSLIERDVEGDTEVVVAHILGYYTQLALDVLKDGMQTTLYSHNTTGLTTTSASAAAGDIGLIARTVIDRCSVRNGKYAHLL